MDQVEFLCAMCLEDEHLRALERGGTPQPRNGDIRAVTLIQGTACCLFHAHRLHSALGLPSNNP